MKKTLKYFSIICVIISIYALTTNQKNSINKANWIIGTWENKTPRGSIFETWKKVNNTDFFGKSYILKEKDTIVFETIQLMQKQNNLIYSPTVRNQNNNLPIHFTSKIVTENLMVFENIKHDFPQKISYKKITKDSLVAEISGTKNGKKRKQSFSMKRIQ